MRMVCRAPAILFLALAPHVELLTGAMLKTAGIPDYEPIRGLSRRFAAVNAVKRAG